MPFTFSGTKALNRTQFVTLRSNPHPTDRVALVTVFTTYNSSAASKPIELVTVGNMSYNKVERSMAVLNIFLNFVQVFFYYFIFKTAISEMNLVWRINKTQSHAGALV